MPARPLPRALTDVAHLRHLAHLARLRLTDEELTALAQEADAILRLFDALPAGATTSEAAPREDGGRADEAAPAPPEQVDAILAQVARRDGRVILVPRGGE